jgi:hypothetical protein
LLRTTRQDDAGVKDVGPRKLHVPA